MIRCRVISPSVKNHKIGDILFLDKETMSVLADFVEAAPLPESPSEPAKKEPTIIVPKYEHKQMKKK